MDKITELITKACAYSGNGDIIPEPDIVITAKRMLIPCQECHKKFVFYWTSGQKKKRCPKCQRENSRRMVRGWKERHK